MMDAYLKVRAVITISISKKNSVFGAGTACVVCPVNRVTYGDRVLDIPTMENGPELATKFLTTLNDLQYGRTRRADWQVIF